MHKPSKRTYSTPKLDSYGSITKLTQALGSGEGGGGGGPIIDIMVILMIP